jgi:glycosyltransferase involved in cell wall biosynthesis
VTVSAVVPVWNGARFLAEALASARAQTRPPDEIIVVDDGSNDASAEIAAAVPGVRVVGQPHAGVAAARNRGLDEARGELIAWLDADDVWTPDKLEIQVAEMEARPELGFTCTLQRMRLENGVARPHWVAPAELVADSRVVGTCSMVARAWAFARVGKFDPRLLLGEDTDWIVRAADLGVPMAVVERTLLERRVHEANLSLGRGAPRKEILQLLRASIARKRGGAP